LVSFNVVVGYSVESPNDFVVVVNFADIAFTFLVIKYWVGSPVEFL
jgi:hypothetical protein